MATLNIKKLFVAGAALVMTLGLSACHYGHDGRGYRHHDGGGYNGPSRGDAHYQEGGGYDGGYYDRRYRRGYRR